MNSLAFTRALAIVMGLALFLPGIARSADSEIEARGKAVNIAAVEQLGVPVEALGILLTASPNSLRPKEYLGRDGWSLVQKLKLAGFVEVTEMQGLPDGTEPEEIFVQIVPTAKGKAAIRGLRAQ